MTLEDINIYVEDMAPSQNKNPHIILNQFKYRMTGEFVGNNEIVLANMLEPIWWNRPLPENTSELIGIEPDGIYSYNFPLFIPKLAWKADYNVLLNKNNIPTAVHLNFNRPITDSEKATLRTMTFTAIKNTLLELGIPKTAIAYMNNDLFLNGKKFVGSEQIIKETVYEENIFITLSVKAEEEIFKRLKIGKTQPKTQITGILDEFPEKFSKEDFVTTYIKYIKQHLAKLE